MLPALLAIAIGVVGFSAGCTNDDAKEKPDAAETELAIPPGRVLPVPDKATYNEADVVFAQDILVNFRQAAEIAGLAQQHSANPQVKALAATAVKNRQPGINAMPRWLDLKRQPQPAYGATTAAPGPTGAAPGPTAASPGPTGMTPSPGPVGIIQALPAVTVSADELASLAAARGAEFDKLFVSLLSRLNSAATELSKKYQNSGVDGILLPFAHRMDREQGVEATELGRLNAGS